MKVTMKDKLVSTKQASYIMSSQYQVSSGITPKLEIKANKDVFL